MKILAISAVVATIATQASALSCLPVHHVTSFEQAANSELSYFILHGTFTFEPKPFPTIEERNAPDYQPAILVSEFEGKVLTQEGFVDYPPFQVALKPTCLGPWCGNMATGVETLAFAARLDTGGLMVEPAPCGGQAFQEVTEDMIRDIEACAAGNCPDVPEVVPSDG
jgi:hypothetical protein